MNESLNRLSEDAYGAYAAVTDGKNFRGEPMPPFAELPPAIQRAWQAAADYCAQQAQPEQAKLIQLLNKNLVVERNRNLELWKEWSKIEDRIQSGERWERHRDRLAQVVWSLIEQDGVFDLADLRQVARDLALEER